MCDYARRYAVCCCNSKHYAEHCDRAVIIIRVVWSSNMAPEDDFEAVF